jgi:quinol monooxygenase YgiN
MIIVAGHAKVDPTQIEALVAAALPMMTASRAEPGCLAYSLAVSNAAQGELTIYERWEDDAALKRHFQMPHMGAFQAAIAGKISELSVEIYDIAGVRPLKL